MTLDYIKKSGFANSKDTSPPAQTSPSEKPSQNAAQTDFSSKKPNPQERRARKAATFGLLPIPSGRATVLYPNEPGWVGSPGPANILAKPVTAQEQRVLIQRRQDYAAAAPERAQVAHDKRYAAKRRGAEEIKGWADGAVQFTAATADVAFGWLYAMVDEDIEKKRFERGMQMIDTGMALTTPEGREMLRKNLTKAWGQLTEFGNREGAALRAQLALGLLSGWATGGPATTGKTALTMAGKIAEDAGDAIKKIERMNPVPDSIKGPARPANNSPDYRGTGNVSDLEAKRIQQQAEIPQQVGQESNIPLEVDAAETVAMAGGMPPTPPGPPRRGPGSRQARPGISGQPAPAPVVPAPTQPTLPPQPVAAPRPRVDEAPPASRPLRALTPEDEKLLDASYHRDDPARIDFANFLRYRGRNARIIPRPTLDRLTGKPLPWVILRDAVKARRAQLGTPTGPEISAYIDSLELQKIYPSLTADRKEFHLKESLVYSDKINPTTGKRDLEILDADLMHYIQRSKKLLQEYEAAKNELLAGIEDLKVKENFNYRLDHSPTGTGQLDPHLVQEIRRYKHEAKEAKAAQPEEHWINPDQLNAPTMPERPAVPMRQEPALDPAIFNRPTMLEITPIPAAPALANPANPGRPLQLIPAPPRPAKARPVGRIAAKPPAVFPTKHVARFGAHTKEGHLLKPGNLYLGTVEKSYQTKLLPGGGQKSLAVYDYAPPKNSTHPLHERRVSGKISVNSPQKPKTHSEILPDAPQWKMAFNPDGSIRWELHFDRIPFENKIALPPGSEIDLTVTEIIRKPGQKKEYQEKILITFDPE